SMTEVLAPSETGERATSRRTLRNSSRRVTKYGVDCTPPIVALPRSEEMPPASDVAFAFGTAATTSCALYSRFGMRMNARAPAQARRDDGASRGERLEQHVGKSLVPARHEEEIEGGDHVGAVRRGQPRDAIAETELADQRANAGAFGSVAGEHHAGRRPHIED